MISFLLPFIFGAIIIISIKLYDKSLREKDTVIKYILCNIKVCNSHLNNGNNNVVLKDINTTLERLPQFITNLDREGVVWNYLIIRPKNGNNFRIDKDQYYRNKRIIYILVRNQNRELKLGQI